MHYFFRVYFHLALLFRYFCTLIHDPPVQEVSCHELWAGPWNQWVTFHGNCSEFITILSHLGWAWKAPAQESLNLKSISFRQNGVEQVENVKVENFQLFQLHFLLTISEGFHSFSVFFFIL